jgi:two-component sensor histidine kinase
MIDPLSGDIPFEEAREWFSTKPLASCAFVAALSIIAVGLRVAISPWIEAAGFVSFLPFIVIIAYLTGPKWAYFGLGLIAVLVWGFALSPKLNLLAGARRDPADLALFAVAGVAVIEFVWLLERALTNLKKERRRALAAVEQRQALMDELAHRTSNNFQMVSAMLQLAKRTMTDPAAQKALAEASDRIHAMATVQRHLSRDGGSGIEVNAFLPTLCADLEKALSVPIACSTGSLPPLSSKAISALALAVQELTANAVEHGAEAGALTNLTVRLAKDGDDHGTLVVEDDGRGLPPDFDLATVRSLGLTLARSFVQDIQGDFDIRNRLGGGGVVATIRFPLKAASASGICPVPAGSESRSSFGQQLKLG